MSKDLPRGAGKVFRDEVQIYAYQTTVNLNLQ
jgi:hypothetical protein